MLELLNILNLAVKVILAIPAIIFHAADFVGNVSESVGAAGFHGINGDLAAVQMEIEEIGDGANEKAMKLCRFYDQVDDVLDKYVGGTDNDNRHKGGCEVR